MDPSLIAFFSFVVEQGPWAIVVYGLWLIGTRRLRLDREYDKLAGDAEDAAVKAVEREAKLVGEVEFWRSRHLQQLEMSQTAMGALSGGRRGAS